MNLVLIGGGNNGHTRSDGTKTPYELKEIDEYVSTLTNEKRLLFIGHANKEFERTYFKTIKEIYEPLGFECKIMKLNFIKNQDKCRELLDWSSIIYIGGGNTKVMLDKWKDYNFTELFLSYLDKKIIVGISAGACIFFKKFNTDSFLQETGEYKIIDGLNVIPYMMTPHANDLERLKVTNDYIKDNNIINLSFSKSIALHIKDDNYKIIKCKLDDFKPFLKVNNKEITKDGLLSKII
jgi:dipeptidase E